MRECEGSVISRRLFTVLSATDPFKAFHAGHHYAIRDKWLARARSATDVEARKSAVRIAREHHHDMLRSVRLLPPKVRA
jgi:hypothetical protein